MIRKKNVAIQTVGEILPRAIRHLRKSPHYRTYLLRHYWQEIVGEELASRTAIHDLQYGKLVLGVADSSLAANLVYMKLEMVQKINEYFKADFVKEISFVYGQPSKLHYRARTKEQFQLRDRLQQLELPEAAQAKIEQLTAQVQDPELAALSNRLLTTAKKIQLLKKNRQWHACARCGVLCPPQETYCPECRRVLKEEKSAAIRQVLLVKPWARYAEIKRYVDCTQAEAVKARIALVQRLAAQINIDAANYADDIQIKTLIMLYRAIPPEQLTKKVLVENLRRLKYDLNYQEMLKLGPKKGKK